MIKKRIALGLKVPKSLIIFFFSIQDPKITLFRAENVYFRGKDINQVFVFRFCSNTKTSNFMVTFESMLFLSI